MERMSLIDERVITLFSPETILDDVKRVLRNLGIAFEVRKEGENEYRIFGKKDKFDVLVTISTVWKPFRSLPGFSTGKSLAIADPAPIVTVRTYSSGDEAFKATLRQRLELGLLRAGG